MLRRFFIILLLGVILAPAQVSSQDYSDNELITSFFNELYSFRFVNAKDDLSQILQTIEDPDIVDICIANFHWWMIVTREKNDDEKAGLRSSMDRIIKRHKESPAGELSHHELFALVHAYAYKTRLDAHEGNYFRGLRNLNLAVGYLEKVNSLATNNQELMLLAGLYNYFGGTILDKFPVLYPFFAMAPRTNSREGLKMLKQCAESDDPLVRTEARYFIMKVGNHLEKNPGKADEYAVKLLTDYPENQYFRSYRIIVLADAGRITEALKEYDLLLYSQEGEVQISDEQYIFLVEEAGNYLRKKRIKT